MASHYRLTHPRDARTIDRRLNELAAPKRFRLTPDRLLLWRYQHTPCKCGDSGVCDCQVAQLGAELSRREREPEPGTRYLLLGVASLVGLGIAVGVLGQRIAASETSPMPCHEDEALIWVDAPNTAGCVPLDILTEVHK